MDTNSRERLSAARTVVIKVGSSLLANLSGAGVKTVFLQCLVKQIAAQKAAGRQIVLVSSGAVAAGCVRLKLEKRPTETAQLQAAAAVGQCELMRLYREEFQKYGLEAAQILLTSDGLNMRERYLHARNTMHALLRFGTVPIVNENDTVAVKELKLKMGDNDALAVAVAQLVDADAIIILSDVAGLYDRPPTDEGATLISHVEKLTRDHFAGASGSQSGVGSGGMSSKLGAALGAAYGGMPLVVAAGAQENVIGDILSGREVGTFFEPHDKKTGSRGQWFAFGRQVSGRLDVDAGAAQALVVGKHSLLPVGVKRLSGDFCEGDTVGIFSPEGVEIARGIVNYDAATAARLIGLSSGETARVLGDGHEETLVHRDNLVIME